VGAAGAVLVLLVALLGPALQRIPIQGLRLVVGALLLAFGLQWLKKAILRSSGYKALHDEDEAFREGQAQAATGGAERRAGLDWYSFTVAFKGVLLEGLEVVFIALTFGSNQQNIGLAALAAIAAVLAVTVAGCAVRAPLSRVPENSMKFVVGVMLTAFGMYWGAEGAGAHWPGSDAALLVLIPAVALYALALVVLFRRDTTYTSAVGDPAVPRREGLS
jgi:uncharacterized membrane protein